jgi:hypothetical protein
LHSSLVKIVIKELWELVDYKQKQIEWMAMVLGATSSIKDFAIVWFRKLSLQESRPHFESLMQK